MAALVAATRSGQWLVSFPTDTVPALAVRPDQAALIFEAKQRPADKPLILMAASPEALWPFVTGTPSEWQVWRQVVRSYWPGALTLVLPASDRLRTAFGDRIPLGLNAAQQPTIGLRVPDSPLARTILEQTGPLATTSINRSGLPPLTAPDEIDQQFPEVLVLMAESWGQSSTSRRSLPSTVAQWTGQGWTILRQGAVHLS